MSKPYKYLVIAAVSLGALLVWSILSFKAFVKNPIIIAHQKPITFIYASGTSSRALAFQLYRLKVIKNPLFFIILAHLDGNWCSLKVGEYTIRPRTTPRQLLKQLAQGESNMHAFTIVEGWTFQKFKDELIKNSYLIHTISTLEESDIMSTIGHKGEMPEGRFAPNTYLFYAGTKDTDILKMSYNLLRQQLHQAWEKRAKDLPYTAPYQALIVASIIEKESALREERFKISGIIARRLKKNVPLALDPTIIYELKRNNSSFKKLTSKDLTKNLVYNTYLYRGLPPTPISLPSKESIEAALHPLSGKELYFVAKGDGGHEFSETLADHHRAIEKYAKGGLQDEKKR